MTINKNTDGTYTINVDQTEKKSIEEAICLQWLEWGNITMDSVEGKNDYNYESCKRVREVYRQMLIAIESCD